MAEELHWEEGMLEELARSVTFPPAPDMRGAVLARLESGVAVRDSLPVWRFAIAGLVVAVVAAAAVVTLSRDARDAVAEFLGIAVEGEQIEVLPTPQPGMSPTPFPTQQAGAAQFETFATEVSRSEAIALGIPLRLPASLGEPLRFWYVSGGPDVVIADYGGLQVWQMAYEGDYHIAKGIVGGGDVVEEVRVNGRPGYWVRGGERIVSIRTSGGSVLSGTQRTVTASALLWSADGLYSRIEGARSLEEAMELAEEMR